MPRSYDRRTERDGRWLTTVLVLTTVMLLGVAAVLGLAVGGLYSIIF